MVCTPMYEPLYNPHATDTQHTNRSTRSFLIEEEEEEEEENTFLIPTPSGNPPRLLTG